MDIFKNSEEEGFTLVEMVMTLVVIGIVALAAYPSMLLSLQMLELNKTTTSAATTVQEVIEVLRSEPTCVNMGLVNASLGDPFQDSRGVDYSVAIEYLNDDASCEDGTAVPLRLTATRDRDGEELLSQEIQIFIPPASGSFDLGG